MSHHDVGLHLLYQKDISMTVCVCEDATARKTFSGVILVSGGRCEYKFVFA